jgi:cytochrome P450
VSAGDYLAYIPYFMGRNEEYWENPLQFDPDRWVTKDLKHPFQVREAVPTNAQYLPFYGGPMSCLGRHMALSEAKTLLCLVLSRFSFNEVSNKPIKPYFGIVMPSANGAHCYVTLDKQ